MSEKLLPCPICGDKLKIHGPEDWKPTCYDPDSGGDPYSASCDCGFHYSNGSYDYSEFILCLNRRAQPDNAPLTFRELVDLPEDTMIAMVGPKEAVLRGDVEQYGVTYGACRAMPERSET